MTLEEISLKINDMDKTHHIEILRIIKQCQPTILISENSNGSFLNMNELTEETISNIKTHIELNDTREEELNKHETLKNTIINNLNTI